MTPSLWAAAAAVGAAGTALCAWLMIWHRRGLPALRALDKDFQCLDMRFRYTPKEAFEGFDRLGAEGRALLKRFWLVDYGFIASLLLVMLAVAHNNAAAVAPLRIAMDAAACLRALMDMLENTLLIRAAGAYPAKRLEGMTGAASAVTTVKWVLMALWVSGLFGILLFRAAQI